MTKKTETRKSEIEDFSDDEQESRMTTLIKIMVPIVAVVLVALLVMSEVEHRSITKNAQVDIEIQEAVDKALSDVEGCYYVVDEDGLCKFATNGLCKLIKSKRLDIIGRNMHDVLHHHREDGSVYLIGDCDMFRAMKDGRVTSLDRDVIWDSNNKKIVCSWTSSPFLVRDHSFTKISIYPIND